MDRKKIVSIVIPVYNEEAVIDELRKRLGQLMDRQKQYDFEVVSVENGSMDESFEKLMFIHRQDPRFKIVQLSRNFTADGGVAAGLQYASGDCAVLMDADLQDPPEVVDKFLEKWEQGYEIVYGIIKKREGVSLIRNLFNTIFYNFLNFVTKGLLPKNVTAFRLMDRKVYEALNRMKESNRFTRGLSMWTGFRQIGVDFVRSPRFSGESKAPFWDIFKEACDAIFAFSYLPLKVITTLGIIISLFSFLFLLVQLRMIVFMGGDPPGYPTLITIMLLMFGILFFLLGIIGEYLSRIYDEVKNRPLYITRQEVGFNKK